MHRREDLDRDGRELERCAVDEEELLLHPNRELRAERVGAHCCSNAVAAATLPSTSAAASPLAYPPVAMPPTSQPAA